MAQQTDTATDTPFTDRFQADRGTPPCQTSDCPATAHFRTGYTHCLEHDHADPETVAGELESVGIATGSFTYFFGASCGSSRKTLRQMEEPNVMLSYATRTNTPWDGIETLMVDSGGYSLLDKGEGEYTDSVDDYLDYVEESGAEWFITRDVPAADNVLATLDRDVDEAIARTVTLTGETLDRASDHGIDASPVAVVQGVTPDDYRRCYHELVQADAVTGRLAIGSLKSVPTEQTVRIISAVREALDADGNDDVELHGLGVDVPVLEYASVRRALASADSSRYIATARWRANRGEQPPRLRDDEPRSPWFETARAYMDMRASLRELLDVADRPAGVECGAGEEQQALADY